MHFDLSANTDVYPGSIKVFASHTVPSIQTEVTIGPFLRLRLKCWSSVENAPIADVLDENRLPK